MRKILTSKAVHLAIKRGEGLEAFKKKYGYGDEEELLKDLKRVASAGADDLFRELKRSGSKQQRKVQEKINSNLSPTSPKKEENEEDLFERLKQREQELLSQITWLQKQEKGLEYKKNTLENESKERKDRCEELKKQLLKEEEKMNILSAKFLEIEKTKKSVGEKIRRLRTTLSEVQDEVKKFESVQVWVYASGEIELDDKSLVNVSTEKAQTIFNELIKNQPEEVSDLTICQLRALAKTTVLIEEMRTKGRKAQVIFEDERPQEVWDSLHANN